MKNMMLETMINLEIKIKRNKNYVFSLQKIKVRVKEAKMMFINLMTCFLKENLNKNNKI